MGEYQTPFGRLFSFTPVSQFRIQWRVLLVCATLLLGWPVFVTCGSQYWFFLEYVVTDCVTSKPDWDVFWLCDCILIWQFSYLLKSINMFTLYCEFSLWFWRGILVSWWDTGDLCKVSVFVRFDSKTPGSFVTFVFVRFNSKTPFWYPISQVCGKNAD